MFPEVRNLMQVSYLKALANKNNIKNVIQMNKAIKLELVSADKLSLELIQELSLEYGRALAFNLSNEPSLNTGSRAMPLRNLPNFWKKLTVLR